jgi:uroporphyrinogen III methyltransferase/synthase
VEKEGLQEALAGIKIACIGPVTADAARKAGLSVVIEPEENTLESVSEAILRYFGAKPSKVELKEA